MSTTRLSKIIVFRVTPKDYVYIKKTALRLRLTASDFLRILLRDRRRDLYNTVLLFDISRELNALCNSNNCCEESREKIQDILDRLMELLGDKGKDKINRDKQEDK